VLLVSIFCHRPHQSFTINWKIHYQSTWAKASIIYIRFIETWLLSTTVWHHLASVSHGRHRICSTLIVRIKQNNFSIISYFILQQKGKAKALPFFYAEILRFCGRTVSSKVSTIVIFICVLIKKNCFSYCKMCVICSKVKFITNITNFTGTHTFYFYNNKHTLSLRTQHLPQNTHSLSKSTRVS
jgi:hypothetical protein